jgi:uncharacterized protein
MKQMLSSNFSLFFATDLHGSEKCFRKFINAAKFYNVDALFLGGDLTAKSVVSLWRDSRGNWIVAERDGRTRTLSEFEAGNFSQAARDTGHYITDRPPAELLQMTKEEKDTLYRSLATTRLREWLEIANSKFGPAAVPIFAIPGNDDPLEFNSLFAEYSFAWYLDAAAIEIAPSLWIVGFGGSNITPWNTYREMTEGELASSLEGLLRTVPSGAATIFHVHVPPFGSGLDTGPALNHELRIKVGPGGPEMVPLGSPAVRNAVQSRQPCLGLFGHIHEGRSATKLGKSLCVNPGSQFWTGNLFGFWATIDGNRVVDWRLTEG